MIANGHPPDAVRHYTPQQVNLFTKHAAQRRQLEQVALASATAVGSSVGFTGNDKPLRKMERNVRGRVTHGSAGMNKARDHLHDHLRKLRREGKVK